MNRNPGFPASTCSIKLPDGTVPKDENCNNGNDPETNYKKRQQLIAFGHSQWGFKNWSWSVTRQDLDFIDYANGKYSAGVVAFVSVTVKSLGIHREDVGYATSVSTQKGSAIHNARKSSVTNALRETLLSFGGQIASQLSDQLEQAKASQPEPTTTVPLVKQIETTGNLAEPKKCSSNNSNGQQPQRKDSRDSSSSSGDSRHTKSPQRGAPPQTVITNNNKVVPPAGMVPPPPSNVGNASEEELRAERLRKVRLKQEELKRSLGII